jgi:hypothetical protein
MVVVTASFLKFIFNSFALRHHDTHQKAQWLSRDFGFGNCLTTWSTIAARGMDDNATP